MSMSEQEKNFWYQKFTLQGRIFYPALTKPQPTRNGVPKYSVLFAFKMNDPANQAALQAIGAFLGNVKQNYFPSIPMQFFQNPLKKWGEYVRQDGKPNHAFLEGCYWINLTSGTDFPPPVVDKFKQPIMNEAEVYSGRNAVVSLSFYKIDKEKKGAGANINAVMLLDGGEPVQGSGTVNIDEVFGGFAAQMGGNVQAPQQQSSMNFNPGHNAFNQQPQQNNQFAPQGQQQMGNQNATASNQQAQFNGQGQGMNVQPAQTFPSNNNNGGFSGSMI